MSERFLERPFVVNPFISRVLELFDSLRYRNENFGSASCALITGESGSGKSELAKQYLKRNQAVYETERTYIPVFHFELKAVSTPVEFLRSALIELGDPQSGQRARNASELFNRLVILLKSTGVELIVFDEVQVIIERRSERVITGLADLFKDIIKATKVPIVFMGMPWSRYLVDSNPQLRGRISYRYEIPPYRISDTKNRDDYRRLLKSLADHFGFGEQLQPTSSVMTLRTFSFTNGNLRSTANLFFDAYILMVTEKRKVDLSLFADAVKAYGVRDDRNPFRVPLEKLQIRELVVHSDWDFGRGRNQPSMIDAEFAFFGVNSDRELISLSA